ncbi:MAG: rRNA pseudouridine synthase [Clostridia bacterium]|nr:rRNA pseudouridine synthase [Clostridia bacterium]
MEEVRLQKFLAEAGVASRRKAEELISSGRVSVNGLVVTGMGLKVSPKDRIEVDGKVITQEENKVYIMLNKPVGYVTTVKDQFSRPTVIDLAKDIKERVYPVGRLDYDTSGLILLTNDGEFAYRFTHPKHEVEKCYIAEVKGTPSQLDIENFETGLEIEDFTTAPAKLKVLNKERYSSQVEIIIHEGRNRQVRKMCEAIGHPVLKLKRIAIGKLKLDTLPEGKWRKLTYKELKLID